MCLDNSRSSLLVLLRGLALVAALGGRIGGLERLLEVGDDVVNVLSADRDTNEILRG